MKKLIILLIVLVNIGVCNAIDPFAEIGIPADKVLHAEGTYLLSDYLQDGLKWDNWSVFWGVTAMAYGKELIDERCGGKFDITDIYADYVGWAIRRVFVVKLKF